MVGRHVAAWLLHVCQLDDVTTEPDDRHRQRVDGDLQGQHDSAVGIEAHERGRLTGRPEQLAAPLDDQTGGHQLAHEPADGAAGQTGALRPAPTASGPSVCKACTSAVEVGPADGLAALPGVPCHGICASRALNVGEQAAPLAGGCQERAVSVAAGGGAMTGDRGLVHDVGDRTIDGAGRSSLAPGRQSASDSIADS